MIPFLKGYVMETYKYYCNKNGTIKEFNSAEECAQYAHVHKWDVVNGCLGKSKTPEYNKWFSRYRTKNYDNSKFLYENPRNENGEFILQNKIPGVTEQSENEGILVEHIPTGNIYMNILEASDGTNTNAGSILNALKNRGSQRTNFRVAFHDMTHQFENGVKDIGWYSPTFDARKIDENNLGDETDRILSRYLDAQKESRLTAEQVMEDSPIEYYDIYGDLCSEFKSIMEASHFYRIHPTHILEAINGMSPLNGRFKLL